ncbi:2-deoxystreptamine glucosyltransferase [Pseudidiomarina piscicola]|uniref:2-deoxystreptamine glucosyltransferase n=1 Tax=Pseudidiomarina piscicola TaxID=2614830 RepID=A0A6S6WNW0_9GAMM|nr:glycosyltransferase family 4 protein [Pseudidiomarina piscicola]CAB0151184.1 2-deoxystreptamine glucosyltransferase [Pseudidiomarina piscicola]VZT40690.1 2-deoxystreptamine glucosyltransferase [Pseudomonas aeruginosa]
MIYLVATAIKHGKGGISTALSGVVEVLKKEHHDVQLVESHQGNKSKWRSFRHAHKLLLSARNGDVVWLHGARWLSLLRKSLLALGPKRRGATVVLHLHGIEAIHYLQHPLGRWLMQRVVNRCDGLVVLTPWWKRELGQYLTFPEARIHIMPNTLDQGLMELAKRPRTRSSIALNESVQMLCMTRLEEGKNVAAAIATLQFLPRSYQLTIAGDGAEFERLKLLTQQLNLSDRVAFLGWVPYSEKNDVLRQMDVFLLPSELDSFGMGFLEAMAAGLPVIAVAYGPINDVVPKCAGELVASPTPQLLASAVTNVVCEHSERSDYAKRYVLKHYRADTVVQAFIEFVQQLDSTPE